MLRRMDLTRMNDRSEKSFQIVSTKRAAMDVMSTDGTSTAMMSDVDVAQQKPPDVVGKRPGPQPSGALWRGQPS